jgi:hypothetical protein|tara:strand:- start:73 stop:540 length:468 start_codon:yes stop_codon:yes gene_type:complete
MALTDNKNLLQPTGFRVIVERENYGNLEFFAQAVSHPGATVAAVEIPVPRIQGLPMPGDTISYGELSLNLILDEELSAYKEVQKWLEDSVYGNREVIHHDISVLILSSHNNSCAKINYKNCIPTQLGAIEFSSTAGDVTYVNFDATFRFTEFVLL